MSFSWFWVLMLHMGLDTAESRCVVYLVVVCFTCGLLLLLVRVGFGLLYFQGFRFLDLLIAWCLLI